ncbi:hypothetical protein JQC67_01730 [Aurantibacter crassamenti]|uniref:hypothetical protein n=1 Tax=Aurantibacter crassamenti TaxID=1837375 RepID=UPI00193A41BE|nr:hypothetical protein [Aurantibacter crassamenti]MBM1104846.1 hypothetical protein [Aurantibacter crassamenti]
MKKNILYILFVISIVTYSCKEGKSTETNQMNKVMAIHDEVMPEMGTIAKLVGELKALENDSTNIDKGYEQARIDLQNAHKSMMDWMKGFGDRFDSDEILNGKTLSTEKQKWLDEEENKVNAVKEQINSSIENAEKLLKSE